MDSHVIEWNEGSRWGPSIAGLRGVNGTASFGKTSAGGSSRLAAGCRLLAAGELLRLLWGDRGRPGRALGRRDRGAASEQDQLRLRAADRAADLGGAAVIRRPARGMDW